MKKTLIFFLFLCFISCGCAQKENQEPIISEPEIIKESIEIVNVDSNTRPFAVVINNATVAIKVQTGLQKAYLVYEIPVEGNMTRLLALYKDVDDLKLGTIRSARHNFLDYVFEHDAIFVHYGWSHYAKDDITALRVQNLNGLYDSSFWRENPEKLAVEHTAYTSLKKSRELAKQKGYSLTTNQGLVLDYSLDEVNLKEKEQAKKAEKIYIPSSNVSNTTYEYDRDNKVYKRFVNGNQHIDYETKEQYTVKNILIQKINTKLASDKYYWDLDTVGSGEGVYITNGMAVPIKWKKESRTSKTVYQYLDDSIIQLNDGNTFIQLQSNNQTYKIEEVNE